MSKKKPVTESKFIIPQISFKSILNLHLNVKSKTDTSDCVEMIGESFAEGSSTLIHDDMSFCEKKAVYFLDAKKNKIKLWPVMINTSIGILPLMSDKPCRNCHHTYSTCPIGCPIQYYPHIVEDSPRKIQIQTFLRENNFQSQLTDYFVTEHMFCTLPCVRAYIFSCLSKNPMSRKYGDSLSYLLLMFKKLNNIEGIPENIPIAPMIETLVNYNGHLKIDEYRNLNDVLHYFTINIKRPIMFASCGYIEENSK